MEPMEPDEQYTVVVTSGKFFKSERDREREQAARRKARLLFFHIPQLLAWITSYQSNRRLRRGEDGKFLNQKLLE